MTQYASHRPALLFDLDGTLVDSVYQHVLAWHEALEEMGLSLAVWRIHRRIGMSGGLLIQALGREIGDRLTREQEQILQEKHSAAFERYKGAIQPLPGARELLRHLSDASVAYAIATSGRREGAQPAIDKLEVRPEGSDHHSRRSRTRKAGSGPLSGCGAKSQCSHLPRDGRRRQRLGPVGCPESRLSRDRAAFGRVWKRGVATSRSL